jgi:hypothetical protein
LNEFGGMVGFLIFAVLSFGLYFLPSFVGWRKRSSGAIAILNLLLGWTFIGWVVALVWAMTAEQPVAVVIQQGSQPLMPAPAAIFCSACGKYSPAGSRFCQTCGGSLRTA